MLGAATAWREAGDSCSSLADGPHAFDNRQGEEEAVIYLVIEGGWTNNWREET